MLYSIEDNKPVDYIPHQKEFNLWRGRLSDNEFEAIETKLNSLIDKDEIHISSWMPGNNWTGTVYEPIFTKACNMDRNLSGLCFGLFAWYVFKSRPDDWCFMKYPKGEFPATGMTYFRKRF